MFETAQKYSEYKYYRKKDLEKEMDHYLVEPLWHEILQYRNFFKVPFPMKQKQTYLIRNPYVNDCMCRTQELLYAYCNAHAHQRIEEIDCFWLKQDELLFYQSFLCQLQHQQPYQHRFMMTHLIEQCDLQSNLSQSLLKYLMEDHNVLLQLFYCCMEADKRSAFLLYYPLLRQHQVLFFANLCLSEEMMDWLEQPQEDLDVTRNFLSFLEHIRLKLSTEMVSLKTYGEREVLEMRAQELLEQFPMLSKEQVLFYVEHRKLHHYYTLQDYMGMHHCCYETARYSMEKLVDLKWYQKQKMGKKFVYFIL